MALLSFKGNFPQLGKRVFVAPTASIIGDVIVGDNTNIWFGVTIRADVNTVRIGCDTNIQDGTVCHVTYKTGALVIGSRVTVGHSAVLHACTLQDESFVGMGAIVMDSAVIETGAMVAAGALVPPGKTVKAGQVWAGTPAKYLRDMTQDEINYLPWSAQHYVKLAQQYLSESEKSQNKNLEDCQ